MLPKPTPHGLNMQQTPTTGFVFGNVNQGFQVTPAPAPGIGFPAPFAQTSMVGNSSSGGSPFSTFSQSQTGFGASSFSNSSSSGSSASSFGTFSSPQQSWPFGSSPPSSGTAFQSTSSMTMNSPIGPSPPGSGFQSSPFGQTTMTMNSPSFEPLGGKGGKDGRKGASGKGAGGKGAGGKGPPTETAGIKVGLVRIFLLKWNFVLFSLCV